MLEDDTKGDFGMRREHDQVGRDTQVRCAPIKWRLCLQCMRHTQGRTTAKEGPAGGLHNVHADIILMKGYFPPGLLVPPQSTKNCELVGLDESKMSYYTGLNIAQRRRRPMDDRPRRPVASLAHHQSIDPEIKSDSKVAASRGHSTTDIAPPIPHRDLRRARFCDRDMLPSQRRLRGDMSASHYDQLVQASSERLWLRVAQNIDPRRAEEVGSSLGSTTTKDFSIAPTRENEMKSPSLASTQSNPRAGVAKQAGRRSAVGSPKTFEEILRGVEKVPTALKK